MPGVAKDKATVTLDRTKVALARALVGARSTSEVLDIALDRLIRGERQRHDIEVDRHLPPQQESALVEFAATAGLHDDTDWQALYAAERE
jgi:hypothetical protein